MSLCRLLLVAALLAPWSSGSAAAASARGQAPAGAGDVLVWPRPPASPAVRYARSVASPADWGITVSLFGRLLDAISGKPQDRFVRPTGVAERDGVLYVADPGAAALWIVDAKQNRLQKVERVGDVTLVSPVAVALGTEGSVFVADSMLKQVYSIDRDGKLLGVAAAQGLERPAGLAFDPVTDRLYVADSVAHRIAVYGPGGEQIRTIGERGTADGAFNGPAYLARGRHGEVLVTDAYNFRIEAFDRDGRFLWKAGRAGDGSGDFAAPKGIATDSDGHVYVVDALFDVVQVFDASGNLLYAFGDHGVNPGQFWLPGGIFISPQDDIYVADAYNRRIQVFRRVPGHEEGAAK